MSKDNTKMTRDKSNPLPLANQPRSDAERLDPTMENLAHQLALADWVADEMEEWGDEEPTLIMMSILTMDEEETC